MSQPDEPQDPLLAYLYGELPNDEVAAFEARLAADPALRAELEGLKATRTFLDDDVRYGLDEGFDAPPPHLVNAILHAEALTRPSALRRVEVAPKVPFVQKLSTWLLGGGVLVGACAVLVVVIARKDTPLAGELSPVVSMPQAAPPASQREPQEPRGDVAGVVEGRVAETAAETADAAVQGKAARKPTRAQAPADALAKNEQAELEAAPKRDAVMFPVVDKGAPEPLPEQPAERRAERPAAAKESAFDDDARVALQAAEVDASASSSSIGGAGAAPSKAKSATGAFGASEAKDAPQAMPAAPAAPPRAAAPAPAPAPTTAAPAGPPALDDAARQLSARMREKSAGEKKRAGPAIGADERAAEASFVLEAAERELTARRFADALDGFLQAQRLDPGGHRLGAAPLVGQIKALDGLHRPREIRALAPALLRRPVDAPGVSDACFLAAKAAVDDKDPQLARQLLQHVATSKVKASAARARAELARLQAPPAAH
jgi:hypothetical protein